MNRPARENNLLERVHSLMHGLKHHMNEAMRAEGDGLGMMEARALRYLAHHAGATQSDLVQQSGRDKAQIARIVKGLLERGLLISEPNPADGRSQVLSVSPLGAALQRRLQAHHEAYEKRLLSGLSPAERTTLMALLDRLQANADNKGE